MSWIITPTQKLDPDAQSYIGRVEQADQANLEPAVIAAINAFVVGCKADGIWNAIKASCILSGARTLNGALQPLVGTAPTNNGPFVSTDYDRKTGLKGDDSTKYLDSNRAGNADPQNSFHASVYVASADTTGISSYLGSQSPAATNISNGMIYTVVGQVNFRSRAANVNQLLGSSSATGLLGITRSSATTQSARISGTTASASINSVAPGAESYFILANNNLGTGANFFSNGAIAFYSIGESLDLAKLDSRVATLINAFAVAIP